MPLANLMNPGCGCCGVKCVIFEDDFDRADADDPGENWSVIAGEWPIVGNQLETADSDAMVLTVAEHSSASMAAVANLTGHADSDELRVIVAAVDGTDYLYGSIVFGSSSSTIHVGNQTGSLNSTTSNEITVGNTYALTVCYDGNRLSAMVAETDGTRRALTDATGVSSSGKKAGLATGTIDGATTPVTFDDFLMLERDDKCQTCGLCDVLPYQDDFETADPNWRVLSGAPFTGISGGTLNVAGDSTFVGQITRCHQPAETDDWKYVFQVTYASRTAGSPAYQSQFQCGNDASVYLDPDNSQYRFVSTAATTNIAKNPADGDIIRVEIEKVGATITAKFFLNDVEEASHSPVGPPGGVAGVVDITFWTDNENSPIWRFDDYSAKLD